AGCIKNGGRCNASAGPPYCCSSYCFQIAGQSYGVCKNR
nr:Chain A, ANTIFUNGAL PEPTIDE [Phytolacca americana]